MIFHRSWCLDIRVTPERRTNSHGLIERHQNDARSTHSLVFIPSFPAAMHLLQQREVAGTDGPADRQIVLATFESRRAAFLSTWRCLPFSLHSRHGPLSVFFLSTSLPPPFSLSLSLRTNERTYFTIVSRRRTKIDRHFLAAKSRRTMRHKSATTRFLPLKSRSRVSFRNNDAHWEKKWPTRVNLKRLSTYFLVASTPE